MAIVEAPMGSAQRLRDQPEYGHNRWHESVEPRVEVSVGDTVVLETRDGFDGQITRKLAPEGFSGLSFLPNHPLTGPVYIREAEAGDLLEVRVIDIEPDPVDRYGFTTIAPGFGLLRDDFDRPFIAHWDLVGRDYAASPQVPGVRIPYAPFCGILGVAPSTALREEVAEREAALAAAGFDVMLPEAAEALPAEQPIASEGLRTIPPRENGGNFDVKQMTIGSSVYLPVLVPGALFSVGDAHFAQGEGESCGAAIEMRARVTVEFAVHKGAAANIEDTTAFLSGTPKPAPPTGTELGFVGLCVEGGRNFSEDLTVASRQASRALVRHLVASGYTPEQAYVILSVAADLRVSQVVNVPNVSVSALLDLSIFEDRGARILDALHNSATN